MKLISKFYQDPKGYTFFIAGKILILYNMHLNTVLAYLISWLKGITIGKGVKFYGQTRFRRYYGSHISLGNNCRLRSSLLSNYIGLNRPCMISTLNSHARIIIGDNVGMSGVVIGCAKEIIIGNNVLIGANCTITDTDWHDLLQDKDKTMNVVIEDNVFIGLDTTILKGVRIGRNSIIGAKSLVIGEIPENVIAGGNPCKVIKKL